MNHSAAEPITQDSSKKIINTYDANGNCSDLIDTTGSTVGHYEYGPFGSVVNGTGNLRNSNPWQFSTKYFDAETGLSYFGYRYLADGRWMNRDPIEEFGGHDLYLFVDNSPIQWWDYLGMKMLSSGDANALCRIHNDTRDRIDEEERRRVDGGVAPPRLLPDERTACEKVRDAAKLTPEVKKIFDQFDENKCRMPRVTCDCCSANGEHLPDPPPSGRIRICWNNRERPGFNVAQIMRHEGTHALQLCYGKRHPAKDNCLQRLQREVEAMICAGQCDYTSLDKCLTGGAIASSCLTKKCIADHSTQSVSTAVISQMRSWFEKMKRNRGTKNALCQFPRPDFRGPKSWED